MSKSITCVLSFHLVPRLFPLNAFQVMKSITSRKSSAALTDVSDNFEVVSGASVSLHTTASVEVDGFGTISYHCSMLYILSIFRSDSVYTFKFHLEINEVDRNSMHCLMLLHSVNICSMHKCPM